jgi:hypothetical protein
MVAQVMTADGVVLAAHRASRPFKRKIESDGSVKDVDSRLPKPIATMYLDWRGQWNLPVLNGIASAPILRDDATIHSASGYDVESSLWLEGVPDVSELVPASPTREQAEEALLTVRRTFKTFCFGDAATVYDSTVDVPVVDLSQSPGRDESAFIVAALTAVCRPSLHLAPGAIIRAAPMSGAGAGKGLLARCMAMIAFGRDPHAVTGGGNIEELDKRIAAELIEGGPTLFLDNLNNVALKSELLASAITERPARVRLLGRSQMVPLNPTAFVILTGNGLSMSEDLARRFVIVELDPRTEAPEARRFATNIRADVAARRIELLAALLTIWRWGRLTGGLSPGKPLGNFDQWCRWVRDPLLALGCHDPVDRVAETKERDGRRQVLSDFFDTWWTHHRDRPAAVRDLHDDVKHVADPQNRGRQYLAAHLEKLHGTRLAGFVFTRQAPAGKWGVATFALHRSGAAEAHGGHRGDQDHAIGHGQPGT